MSNTAWLFVGAASFIFALLFDIAKAYGRGRRPELLFFISCALLLASTVGLLWGVSPASLPLWRNICGLISLLFFFALIYILFFALPAEKTYSGAKKAPVVSTGIYGACRHPGFFCLVFLYFFLWLFALTPGTFFALLVFSLLDFIYILLQDFWLFPKYLDGYKQYRSQIPFIFPRF